MSRSFIVGFNIFTACFCSFVAGVRLRDSDGAWWISLLLALINASLAVMQVAGVW